MKCIILAGGSSDRLWPLTRKQLPKQFMSVRKNRSLFQEILARNIPFCDEFLVVTNESYADTVRAQLKEFQGLRCGLLLEKAARGTAPALTLAALQFAPGELLYVVPADHIISGGNYPDAVMTARGLAAKGRIAALGVPAESPSTRYGYLSTDDADSSLPRFVEKPEAAFAGELTGKGCLWNCGLYAFRADVFLSEIERLDPALLSTCRESLARGTALSPDAALLSALPHAGIEHLLFEHTPLLTGVRAEMDWQDIAELETLAELSDEDDTAPVLLDECSNTTVVNRTDDQFIVASHCDDMLIISTPDGLFVSPKEYSASMGRIVRSHHAEYARYFDRNRILFRVWGQYEVLREEPAYRLKRVTVAPGRSMRLHRHAHRTESWTIISGTAKITIAGETKEYPAGSCVCAPAGVPHRLANPTREPLLLIETSLGDLLQEEDTLSSSSLPYEIIKLSPATKDYLWGGERLHTIYGKGEPNTVLAETWELSAHPDGPSRVQSGVCSGLTFPEYLDRLGPEGLGWKSQAYPAFPILIKFIDSAKSLSVQVHPFDEYALLNEHEYGKNEMWHILDCEPGASLYYGFNRDVTREEIASAVEAGTIEELMNRVEVRPGETYFIEAGTVHAIGAGITLCEIQQSSNSTYRLYDFKRRDKNGNLRPLHLAKALDVLDLKKRELPKPEPVKQNGSVTLTSCKYFESTLLSVENEAEIPMTTASFLALTILDGSGVMICGEQSIPFVRGDSLFAPAARTTLTVKGTCRLITTHI